jgi:hypothetical protein
MAGRYGAGVYIRGIVVPFYHSATTLGEDHISISRGKPINPADCLVVYNSNETGSLNDPLLISPIERIHNDGSTKSFKLLGVLLDDICPLMHTLIIYVPKSLNHYFASTG